MRAQYIKLRKHTPISRLFKAKRHGMGYEMDWINYHPSFLSGTTAKTLQYSDTLLYRKLFRRFRKNLRNAEYLIVIGYSGNDEKINEMIYQNFNNGRKAYVVDPQPSEKTKEFANKIGAEIKKESVTELSILL